ncbi:MAG: response regulator [Chloroflexota bacterium]|nr:response regulator [Chloroflexota bacterium]
MVAERADREAVLVVDDDTAVRDLIEIILSDEGYRVRTAGDGRAALTLARDEPPDLVLMDVNMPILDGISACRQLRDDRRTAHLPVMIMSARPVRPAQLDACRADRFLPKPFDIEQLLDEIAHCVAPHSHG